MEGGIVSLDAYRERKAAEQQQPQEPQINVELVPDISDTVERLELSIEEVSSKLAEQSRAIWNQLDEQLQQNTVSILQRLVEARSEYTIIEKELDQDKTNVFTKKKFDQFVHKITKASADKDLLLAALRAKLSSEYNEQIHHLIEEIENMLTLQ